MSFGVSDGGDFEYNGSSPNGLFAKRAHLVTPWFHRMIADLVRFNRNARALLARGRGGPVARPLARRGRLLAGVRRAADRAAGVGGVVGRPAPDVDVPGALPGRVLRQPRDARASPSARSGGRSPAARAPTSTRSRSPGATGCALDTPVTAITRHDGPRAVTPRGGEPERFDEVVLATHSDQALRMLADATDREHEILGAIPYQPNEAVLHTDRALLPRRRRAWASWNYHLLPEPTGLTTVTYHMNRLQALDADREFCVTLNRSEAIDPGEGPAHDLLRAPRLHPRGRPRAGPPRGDQRAQPHALRRRLLALGLPRGRRRQRAARRRALRGAPVTGRCTRARSATAASRCASTRFRHRIALAYLDLDAPPRGFRRSDYLGDASCRCATPCTR